MAFQEKDFQAKFNRFAKASLSGSAAFELKLTHTDSIPFSAVKDHQEAALLAAHTGKLFYKIPDESSGHKPFDCFLLSAVPSFVVIMFYRRSESSFVMIPITVWLREKELSKKRSLTQERAFEIGQVFSLR